MATLQLTIMPRSAFIRRGGILFASTIALTFVLTAQAVLAPEVERENAIQRASEWIDVEITGAWTEEQSMEKVQVVASATVTAVYKSASNLKPGSAILIVYTLDLAAQSAALEKSKDAAGSGWAGLALPGLPVVIRARNRYKAHLALQVGANLGGLVYSPAAAQYSFELVDVAHF